MKHIQKVATTPICMLGSVITFNTYVLGFSLGANIMCKYIGEEGANVNIRGAISVSNPLDFPKSSVHMNSGIYKHTYSKVLAGNLLNYVKKYFTH